MPDKAVTPAGPRRRAPPERRASRRLPTLSRNDSATSATTYVVIARPDPQSAGRYLASCPDIPGWFATGGSPAEASAMGSEIVRGIVAERRANGGEVPAVNMHAVQVTVGAPAARPSAAPDTRESEPKPSSPNSTLASIVARSREHRPAEGGDGESTSSPSLTQGRILKNSPLDV